MHQRRTDPRVERFLDGGPFAVAGASSNRAKFGNKALRSYMQAGREVFPINPNESEVEGLKAYPSLEDLPRRPHGLSIVTPPSVTEKLVRSAVDLGIEHIWMQPGAVHRDAVKLAMDHGVNVIAGDACVMVELGLDEWE